MFVYSRLSYVLNVCPCPMLDHVFRCVVLCSAVLCCNLQVDQHQLGHHPLSALLHRPHAAVVGYFETEEYRIGSILGVAVEPTAPGAGQRESEQHLGGGHPRRVGQARSGEGRRRRRQEAKQCLGMMSCHALF